MDKNTNKPLETAASQSTNLAASASTPSIDMSRYSMVKEKDIANLRVWLGIEKSLLETQAEQNPRLRARMAKATSSLLNDGAIATGDLFEVYPEIRQIYRAYGQIITQLSSYMNANVVALQQSAIEYFSHLYPSADRKDFTFFNKNDGVQVGQVLRINYLDEAKQHREVCYYIKTHQNGSTSQGGGAGAVDLKELFVYKALENMHLGPKAHFFTTGVSTQNGFYIATRGFPFSKDPEKQKQKTFLTYQKFEQEKSLQSLALTDLPNVSNIIHGLTMIDIISRVFKLHDVATNDGNFGFTLNGNTIKGKIIDFRVGAWENYRYAEGLLQGFLAGNGTYNYLYFVGTALRNRLPMEKIAEAQAAIQYLTANTKFDFYNAIQQAYEGICSYVNASHGMWVPPAALAAALTDLKTYFEAVGENFSAFVKEVASMEAATQKLTLKG